MLKITCFFLNLNGMGAVKAGSPGRYAERALRGGGFSSPPPGRACLNPTFRAEAPGDLGLGGMFRPLRMLRFMR